uniref:Venom polypeptide n=1 Tax=Dolopus genitalis TaxID=2488630 RepID=A0A3G5BIH8_DOLGE|nr:venom polypeptide [Dolopus genitalis]
MKSFAAVLLLATTAFAIPALQPRIAGGRTARPTDVPYQVGLDISKYTAKIGEWDEWCGASLVSDQLIVTAAHCLRNAVGADVYLGTINFMKDDEPGRIMVHVKRSAFIIHEDYNHYLLKNDIALIKLPHKVSLSDRIKPLNLPRLSQRDSGFVNRMAWISGWGLTANDADQPDELQVAQRSILRDSKCETTFRLFKKETEICVDGSQGISNCKGDSGGPLAIDEADGTRTLVGIVSYGRPKGCGTGFPSVYTRVTAFLDWIEKNGEITLRK